MWSPAEYHALTYCVGETCESKTSVSSRLGFSNMEKIMGQKKYAQMKKAHNTTLVDDPFDKLFKKKILPFIKKVRNQNTKLVNEQT